MTEVPYLEKSVMYARKLLPFIYLATIVCLCHANSTNSSIASRADYIQKQALDTFKTTCFRLQLLANWMSVLFKLMSAWTSTTTKLMIVKTKLEDSGSRSIPPLPPRPAVGLPGSECSSKSLQVALQTYIHFQAQLLQLKSILGKHILKIGRAKLDDSLQSQIGNLDTLNKTAYEMFEKLKWSSQIINSSESPRNAKILSVIQEVHSSNSFLTSVQERENSTLHQIQEVTENKPNFKQTQALFQAAGFFQNMGRVIDGIFA